MAAWVEPRLADKLAFLSDARNYTPPAGTVQPIETHMSWVFLTAEHAWKLKKPQRADGLDLSTVEARRRHCELELGLNRRFADGVYLGAVALRQRPDGRLTLEREGEPVDWLLKMRRLPGQRMLDRMIGAGTVAPEAIRGIAAAMARFYGACAREPVDGPAWRARLAARIAETARELRGYPQVLGRHGVEDMARRQHGFLVAEAGMVEARAGRVVEGHGDLRPEHVCLEDRPRVIDCLEFSRALRIVDPAEELGFLALECERLGAPGLREPLFAGYEEATGDAPEARLVHFYQSLHACTRAWLALRHLRDASPAHASRWPALASDYLRLAAEHLALCAMPKL